MGWDVEPRGKPFDLFCTKPTGEKHYVEVKASTARLVEILVTNGEINFACAHPDQVDLFPLENVLSTVTGPPVESLRPFFGNAIAPVQCLPIVGITSREKVAAQKKLDGRGH